MSHRIVACNRCPTVRSMVTAGLVKLGALSFDSRIPCFPWSSWHLRYDGGRSIGHLEFLDLLLGGERSSSEHRNGSNSGWGVACLLTLSSAWRLRST